ncbi:MAG TPA: hemolysin III family protein [Myxococcaceae bacterium]
MPESIAARMERPLYRGVSHLYGFFVVLGAVPVLVAFAPSFRASVAASVYGAGLLAMFGCSALFHRTRLSPRATKWLERLDHSAIYLCIAGSYTPFCLLLRGASGPLLLSVVWAGAGMGVLRALFWVDAPHWLSVVLYLMVGWALLPFVPQAWNELGPLSLLLLLVGGVFYSGGAVVFAAKRPDPSPSVFGYHEVFHAAVVVASACHFIAVVVAVKQLGS